ncbi:hypothetical protein [uncultured Paracoccus sp.]|uniref:hypothetical protein n=1 Tax=uncultured Paracoccus sp. TaxID=189685 RepID=UPI0026182E87|nr:hypothetical protein [uncultured Paracoccus sp.]
MVTIFAAGPQHCTYLTDVTRLTQLHVFVETVRDPPLMRQRAPVSLRHVEAGHI